ncbi:hypothetical protein CathTA2_0596 [Caldalkalibacillus thermarum TA2.A1]|uniref:Uncharacterized protein n=1 Tax=Caldalkalibacillus thermarum (strain TA2.A1) TaxID=986075 RepID=F5L484_CALTT|nr:hypothetical protein CathTA2_0596 [Caldalkalibacillus thermarum TA2.A1]
MLLLEKVRGYVRPAGLVQNIVRIFTKTYIKDRKKR